MSRSYSFLSAIDRAAAERTSTRQSSISWMMRRAIFSGSSALSSMALRLELMMSDSREKTPISEPFVVAFSVLVFLFSCQFGRRWSRGRSEDDAGDEEAGDEEAPAFDRPARSASFRRAPLWSSRGFCPARRSIASVSPVVAVLSRHGHRQSNLRASFCVTIYTVVFYMILLIDGLRQFSNLAKTATILLA